MRTGAIRLFRFAGIEVFLHFSWFIVAAFYISSLAKQYDAPVWGVLTYLALFAIVVLHEFGHALACRQVGGVADRIVLWPLGGIAVVNPPPRPGAYLWSIAAGPLVNVALIPFFAIALRAAYHQHAVTGATDSLIFWSQLRFINNGLLIFNLLPIFPLDGGQIVRGLLWYPFGEFRSLQIASVIGLVGGAALGLYGILSGSIWSAVIAMFLLSRAWQGWQAARAMIASGNRSDAVSPTTSEDLERR